MWDFHIVKETKKIWNFESHYRNILKSAIAKFHPFFKPGRSYWCPWKIWHLWSFGQGYTPTWASLIIGWWIICDLCFIFVFLHLYLCIFLLCYCVFGPEPVKLEGEVQGATKYGATEHCHQNVSLKIDINLFQFHEFSENFQIGLQFYSLLSYYKYILAFYSSYSYKIYYLVLTSFI